jgi:hypothetical protein
MRKLLRLERHQAFMAQRLAAYLGVTGPRVRLTVP